ncbi:MAG TPA: flagellar biosynthetic protein FliO [Candidatus Eremiobacteraceae bacterium]|jgi:hypothetical protein
MIAPLARWIARLRRSPRATIDVVAAQPLAAGLAVYVIDIDGHRTVLAAGPHAICVLSAYQAPQNGAPEGQQPVRV